MMAYFYFTRHGQTIWNVENKICGATDIALTELGHTQAKELGERIKAEGIHIDKILYSPLMRAADTAKHIAEVTGVPAEEEMRLKEQNFGRYESTPRNGAEFSVAKAQFVNSYDGGESMLKLSQRIYNLLDDIKKEAESEGTVYLLVAHNGISRIIESYFHDMTNEEFAAFGIKNCVGYFRQKMKHNETYGEKILHRLEKISRNSIQYIPFRLEMQQSN